MIPRRNNMTTSSTVATSFDTFNSVRVHSIVLEDIWRKAYGDEYAADVRPNAFYPQSVLDHIVTASEDDIAWQKLLDIGCGHGTTGLYLAQHMKMQLLGIDISPVSIELAKQNASNRKANAQFWVADASSTELQDQACAVVTCFDVLLYMPNQVAVVKEIHRILKPGGLFAFTTWEQNGYSKRLGTQQIGDYRSLLEGAGFEVQRYDVVEGAREQQNRVFEGIVGRQDELSEDIGEGPTSMYVKMASGANEESSKREYIFVIARRRN